MTPDIAIIGAGIAGASLAAELAPHASVVLIDGEAHAGYHSTGRSAAFWSETYGGPAIQPLTAASLEPLRPWLEPLGSLHIGRVADEARADAMLAEFEGTGVVLARVDPREHLAGLRDDWCVGVTEPSCAYIDVAGFHAHCVAEAKRGGATLLTDAEVGAIEPRDGHWHLEAGAHRISAGIVVNAAGAWADAVADRAGVRPIGIAPYRRTLVQLRTDPVPPGGMPHVAALDHSFYFKPEAGGRLWLSPSDETATDPCDVQPEELDVAIAIDRLERAVDWRVAQVERRWAGLRSFAPDRRPVYGFAPGAPGFFWCAGQGGFGIQTAPAAAALAAALLLDRPAAHGIDPHFYAPERFYV